MMISEIKAANEAGHRDSETDTLRSYYTPTLQTAYNLGYAGVDLSDAPVVSGYRYGSAPDSYISHNFTDDCAEHGLSLAALDGEKEIGSSVWFADRETYHYEGLLSGLGSDGEPLILAFAAENYDD